MKTRRLIVALILAFLVGTLTGFREAKADDQGAGLSALEARVTHLEVQIKELQQGRFNESITADLSEIKKTMADYDAATAARTFDATLKVMESKSKKTEAFFQIAGLLVALAGVLTALFGYKALSEMVQRMVLHKVNKLMDQRVRAEVEARLQQQISLLSQSHTDMKQQYDQWLRERDEECAELMREMRLVNERAARGA